MPKPGGAIPLPVPPGIGAGRMGMWDGNSVGARPREIDVARPSTDVGPRPAPDAALVAGGGRPDPGDGPDGRAARRPFRSGPPDAGPSAGRVLNHGVQARL